MFSGSRTNRMWRGSSDSMWPSLLTEKRKVLETPSAISGRFNSPPMSRKSVLASSGLRSASTSMPRVGSGLCPMIDSGSWRAASRFTAPPPSETFPRVSIRRSLKLTASWSAQAVGFPSVHMNGVSHIEPSSVKASASESASQATPRLSLRSLRTSPKSVVSCPESPAPALAMRMPLVPIARSSMERRNSPPRISGSASIPESVSSTCPSPISIEAPPPASASRYRSARFSESRPLPASSLGSRFAQASARQRSFSYPRRNGSEPAVSPIEPVMRLVASPKIPKLCPPSGSNVSRRPKSARPRSASINCAGVAPEIVPPALKAVAAIADGESTSPIIWQVLPAKASPTSTSPVNPDDVIPRSAKLIAVSPSSAGRSMRPSVVSAKSPSSFRA